MACQDRRGRGFARVPQTADRGGAARHLRRSHGRGGDGLYAAAWDEGSKTTIQAGDVTKNDINTVLPFGNTVAVIYVSGTELLEALEASTYCTPEAIGGFPQTSGIEWVLDTTKEYDQGDIYTLNGKESSYYAPASIQRVTIKAINGEPFDPDAIYAVVTNNFCAAGGDTYNVFNRAYAEGFGFDTGIPMDEAVMSYVADVLGGTIGEQYAAPSELASQVRP